MTTRKFKRFSSSILSLILCIAMLLTALPPLTANATSGSFTGGQVCNGYRLKITYSESEQNPKTNTSKVTATLYLVQDRTYDLYIGTRSATITINGTKKTISNIPAIRNTGGVTTKLGSASATVTHTSNGAKSISIAATFDMKATLGGTYYGTMKASKTVALDKLDRTAPTVSLEFDSATDNSVTLTASANTTCDNWQYSIDGGSSWVTFGASGTSNTFTISNLEGGTEYSVIAKARKTKNNVTSAASSAVTATTKPSPPGDLTVSDITQTSANLTWNAVTGATSYKIYLNENLIASEITTNSYSFEELESNTSYVFGVSATGTNGDSSISSTSSYITLPNVPTDLTVTGQTDNSVSLSWAQNNGGNAAPTIFNIYRDGVPVGTSDTTSYTDTTYENTDSDYTVSAVTSAGESDQSSSVPVTHIPLSVTLSATNNSTYATVFPTFTGGLNRDIDYTSLKWAYGSQNFDYFVDNGYTFTNSFAVLQNGTYTVYVEDTSGNSAVGTIVISGIYTKPTQGAFVQTFTDLSVDSIGLPIAFERTYNSMDNTSNIFGNCWSLNYAKYTCLSEDGSVQLVYLPDGTINYFSVADNIYTGIRTQNTLVADGDKLILTTKDKIKYTYENNYLTRIEDAYGNSVTIELNSENLPVRITDSVGRVYTIAYNNNRITSITDPAGRVFTYVYDDNGNLIEQKQANGATVNKYIYTNGLLTKITDSLDNTVCEVVYNTQNQVLNITDSEESITYYLYKITNNGEIVIYESDSKIVLNESDCTTHPANNTYNPFDQIVIDSDGLVYEYNLDGTIHKIDGVNSDKTIVVYTYDEKGNVLSIQKSEVLVDETTGEITNSKIAEEITYTYSYFDGTVDISSATEVIVTNTYDDDGNLTETDTQTITTTYDSVGNLLSERTVHNEDDDTVSYTYSDNGLMKSETADGVVTEYTYDANGYITNIKTVEDDVETNASYSYNIIGLVLTEIENGLTHNYHYDNYGILTQRQFDIYTINYNTDGNIISIKQNNTALSIYDYTSNNIVSEVYANGYKLLYDYNENGNVTDVYKTEKTSQNKLYSYTYSQPTETDGKERLLTIVDYEQNRKTLYSYTTSEGEETTTTATTYNTIDETAENAQILYTYASSTNGRNTITIGNKVFSTLYSTEDITETTSEGENKIVGENRISTIEIGTSFWHNINTINSEKVLTSSAVKLGDNTLYAKTYEYNENTELSKETSTIGGVANEIRYSYDDSDNITQIISGIGNITYQYNNSNELIRVNDQFSNKTFMYTYDNRGNIITKQEYSYTEVEDLTELIPIKTDTFGYNKTDRVDELTSFNGNEIIYDASGNPLTYNGYNYTWDKGGQLKQLTNGTNTYFYTYDEKGVRTSKIVNNVTTNYITDNGIIISEYNDAYSIDYMYDENCFLFGFAYTDKTTEIQSTQTYIYIKNMAGDITGIIDATGNIVANYTYDAWGNITTITDGTGVEISVTDKANVANINPMRYRSYYYDNETGYYYLQSRYYYPEICRFINSDEPSNIVFFDSASDCNVFKYVLDSQYLNNTYSNGENNKCLKTFLNKIKQFNKKIKKQIKEFKRYNKFINKKYEVTVFYIKEFENENKYIKKAIKSVFPKSRIKYKEITDDNFTKLWNNCKSDIVVINAHGNSYIIGTESESYFTEDELENLKVRKSIKLLFMLPCSVGEDDFALGFVDYINSNGIVIARNETVYVKYTWFNNMSIQVGRGWQAFYQIRNRTVRENLFGHNSVFYINLSDFMKLIVSFAFSKKLAGS